MDEAGDVQRPTRIYPLRGAIVWQSACLAACELSQIWMFTACCEARCRSVTRSKIAAVMGQSVACVVWGHANNSAGALRSLVRGGGLLPLVIAQPSAMHNDAHKSLIPPLKREEAWSTTSTCHPP